VWVFDDSPFRWISARGSGSENHGAIYNTEGGDQYSVKKKTSLVALRLVAESGVVRGLAPRDIVVGLDVEEKRWAFSE
jgi:hypothetical protein